MLGASPGRLWARSPQ